VFQVQRVPKVTPVRPVHTAVRELLGLLDQQEPRDLLAPQDRWVQLVRQVLRDHLDLPDGQEVPEYKD
jgi:hypothetical protein